jgi:hypothetical protein
MRIVKVLLVASVAALAGTLTVAAQTAPAPAAAGPAQPNIPLPRGVVFFDGARYALPEAAVINNAPAVRALIAAGNALGMVRGNTYGNQTHRTIGHSTHRWQYVATGTMNGEQVKVTMDMDYRLPAVRTRVERAGKPIEITVANGRYAWDESKLGVYSGAAKTSSAERLLPIYLFPQAVIHLAEPESTTIKVAEVGGMRELTIPVPHFKSEMKATLDAKGFPVRTEMRVNGKLYTSEFSNFENDKMDYHVYGPHRILLKVDGTTYADLTASEHSVGRYMIYPVPVEVARN